MSVAERIEATPTPAEVFKIAPITEIFPDNVIPNYDVLAINNLVPGAEMLGYGFNIFGDYDFNSATRPILDLGTASPAKAPNGNTYNVPAHVGIGGGQSSASAYSFDTAEQFTSHFEGSAGISGSYGAFSASFTTAYQTDQQNSSSYSWAMVESKILQWSLRLAYSSSTIRADVHSDPDFANLPSTFEPANAQAFFAFFSKFGTHFINQIDVGGTLYYYSAVSRSSSMSASDIRMSASAEYHALIASVKVESQAEWSRCSKNWTQSRQSHAETVPATSSVVKWVSPSEGTYDENKTFADWEDAVEQFPARTSFRLVPISQLFSGAQAGAVQQAFQAYTQTRALVQSYKDHYSNIILGGRPIVPPGGYPPVTKYGTQFYGQPGWHLVVLDRKTLAIKMNKYYSIDYTKTNWPDPTYDQMVSELGPYIDPGKYILIAATSYMDDGGDPNDNLFRTLESFGGGPWLTRWRSRQCHNCSGGDAVAYILIGASGSPRGCEALVETYLNIGPPDGAISFNAYMQPEMDGTFSPVC